MLPTGYSDIRIIGLPGFVLSIETSTPPSDEEITPVLKVKSAPFSEKEYSLIPLENFISVPTFASSVVVTAPSSVAGYV